MTIELFDVRLNEAIAEVEREIAMRNEVYPARVRDKRMSPEAADRQLWRMEAALAFLIELRGMKGGDHEPTVDV